jgi:hypothetical protein
MGIFNTPILKIYNREKMDHGKENRMGQNRKMTIKKQAEEQKKEMNPSQSLF